jgi:cytochrome c oxidase assembly protein subunit 15
MDLQPDSRRPVARWLFASAASVALVLLVGGLTRLTHSGLSIVEWAPLAGALPPLSEAEWQRLFDAYRQSPEFVKLHPSMGIEAFRGIFWWEWTHRLLARLAAVVFLGPFLWFACTRRLRGALAWRLAGVFALGALQGVLGWAMVASGLVDDPHVSHFRLLAHFSLALAIFAALSWTGLCIQHPAQAVPRALGSAGRALAIAVFLMAATGAMVAGTHAGLVYNTFPRMGEGFVPPELLAFNPWTDNFLFNPVTIQFVHRLFAAVLLAGTIALVIAVRSRRGDSRALHAATLVLAAALLQAGLGIATLLSGGAVPLAAAHQAGAVLLFAGALRLAHALGFSTRRY